MGAKTIFNQDIRFKSKMDKENKNQTYALYSSLGKQNESLKCTRPQIKFSKAKRDNRAGFFLDPKMPSRPKVRLKHARY